MLLKFTFHQLTPWFFKSNTTFDLGTWGDTYKIPQISTVIGAIRSVIGTLKGVDWKKYRLGLVPDVDKLIGKYGTQEELPFVVYGPFIGKGDDVYFPLPSIVKVYPRGENGILVKRAVLTSIEHEYKNYDGSSTRKLRLFGKLPSLKEESGYYLNICGMDNFLKGKDIKEKDVEYIEFAEVVEEIGVSLNLDRRAAGEENGMYRIRRIFMKPSFTIVAYAYFADNVRENVPIGIVEVPFGGKGMSKVEVSIGEDLIRKWITSRGNLVYLASDYYLSSDGLPLPNLDVPVKAAAVGKPRPYRVLPSGMSIDKSTGVVKHLAPQGSVFVFEEKTYIKNIPFFWGKEEV